MRPTGVASHRNALTSALSGLPSWNTHERSCCAIASASDTVHRLPPYGSLTLPDEEPEGSRAKCGNLRICIAPDRNMSCHATVGRLNHDRKESGVPTCPMRLQTLPRGPKREW